MNSHVVSVIVPVYNAERYLPKTLRSLFGQTLQSMEFLFVDDCSTDSSASIIESILEEYPNRRHQVLYIRNNSNLGAGQSRNIGIENSHGDYLVFCDSDDVVDTSAYEQMLKVAIETNSEMVTCGMTINNIEKLPTGVKTLSARSLFNLKCLEGGIYSSSCNKLIKRSLIFSHGVRFCPALGMWDDLWFTFQLRFFVEHDAILNKALYTYTFNTDSITSADNDKKLISQVKCVALIEEFLISQNAQREYRNVIKFLKLHSKDSLFSVVNKESWRSIYPESHKGMYRYSGFYGLKRIILFYLYANSNIGVVSRVLECYSRFRRCL